MGRARLLIYPDLLGRYATARSLELGSLLESEHLPPAKVCEIPWWARARVPKVIAKLTGRETAMRVPGLGVAVDGYYQTSRAYLCYPALQRQAMLAALRRATRASNQTSAHVEKRVLVHIRLADFFKARTTALAFARRHILTVPRAARIISDEEDLVRTTISDLARTDLELLPTAGLDAWQVLRVMSSHDCLQSNGSTLAFWAAALAGAEFRTTNAAHQALFDLIRSREHQA